MALRSGSLKRKGMLETWSRLGISLGEDGSPEQLVIPRLEPVPDRLDPVTVDPSADDEEALQPVFVAAATAWAAAAAAAALGSPPDSSSVC